MDLKLNKQEDKEYADWTIDVIKKVYFPDPPALMCEESFPFIMGGHLHTHEYTKCKMYAWRDPIRNCWRHDCMHWTLAFRLFQLINMQYNKKLPKSIIDIIGKYVFQPICDGGIGKLTFKSHYLFRNCNGCFTDDCITERSCRGVD